MAQLARLPLRIAAVAICSALLSAVLLSCGQGSRPAPPAATPAPEPPEGTQAGPEPGAATVDWHQLALAARDLNAIAESPSHARVKVAPQAAVDLTAKGAAAVRPVLDGLPAPASLGVDPERGVSDFTADDLIRDASGFDQTLPFYAMTAQAGESQASFNCATNPASPALDASAWAMYRFQFLNYDTSGLPQSIGLLWSEDDAPSRYYIGLADWNANHWRWFEGDNDNVVTVESLSDYIRPDFVLVVAVIVMDNEPRQLEFLQIGAVETRGLGGAAPETMDGQDFSTPELYFPGKAASALDGAPSEHLLSLDYIGQAYDQGPQNSCTACAVAGAHNFEINRNYAPYWRYWDPSMRTSPKWIYRNTLGGAGVGRPPEMAMDYLKNTGGATIRTAPFNTNETNDWYAEASDDALKLKIDGYKKIRSRGQTGIDEIKYALYEWGRPVVFLITIDQALKDSSENQFANGEVWTWNDWVPNIIYWHSMLIVGWDDNKQAFRVRNSWGPEWGMNGDFYVSYDTFSGNAWIDCFVLWDEWNASTAAYFSVNDQSYANVPANFRTSPVHYTDQVVLFWDEVPFADEYLIYRDSKADPIASLPGGTDLFADTGVSDSYGHSYWIRCRVGGATSPYSNFQLGWLELPPAPKIETVYSSSTNVKQGEPVSLWATCYNPLGLELDYTWEFAPGAVAEGDTLTGRRPAVTFIASGSQPVTLTVDNGSNTAEKSFNLNVIPLPQHPVAAFSGPAKGKKSKVLFFDASASSCDAGQSIVEYYWDWDGNGGYDESNTAPLSGHIFPAYGTVDVQLKVRDSRGLYSDWTAHQIEITPYDEVEDNDSSDGANVISMLPLVNYKGSVGARMGYGGFDGDGWDWWKLPAEPGNSWIRVDYNTSEIDQLSLTVWDDAFSFSQFDLDADKNGRAEVIYPPFAISTIYVQVTADSGGGDYTISWEHPSL